MYLHYPWYMWATMVYLYIIQYINITLYIYIYTMHLHQCRPNLAYGKIFCAKVGKDEKALRSVENGLNFF